MRTIIYVVFLIILIPSVVTAQIKITEIMYDPDGTDTGREWIEIYNSGTENVDLGAYKILENNVNHKFSVPEGAESLNLEIKSENWAIVADNPDKFKLDFPSYSGVLIDSAFSLNNTGESISIIGPEGEVLDAAEYLVDLGANGTGNSLQKNSGGFWIPANPTVGRANAEDAEGESYTGSQSETGSNSGVSGSSSGGVTSGGSSNSSSISTHSGQNDLSNYVEKIALAIGAGRNRISAINTPIDFVAQYNSKKKPKFVWSFGDGSTGKGNGPTHHYDHSGTYNVVLNGRLDKEIATARTKITVVDPAVEILSIIYGQSVGISIKNVDKKELNLGGYEIDIGQQEFIIPKDTIISGNTSVIFSPEITNFMLDDTYEKAKLKFPTGRTLAQEI